MGRGKAEIVLETGQWTSFLSLISPFFPSFFPPQAVMLSNETTPHFSLPLPPHRQTPCLHFLANLPLFPPFLPSHLPHELWISKRLGPGSLPAPAHQTASSVPNFVLPKRSCCADVPPHQGRTEPPQMQKISSNYKLIFWMNRQIV